MFCVVELLAIEKSNITYYNERLTCGIALEYDKQVGSYLWHILYSGNFLHSSPVAVNLISNVILQSATRGQYEIHVNNNPLMRFVQSTNLFWFFRCTKNDVTRFQGQIIGQQK